MVEFLHERLHISRLQNIVHFSEEKQHAEAIESDRVDGQLDHAGVEGKSVEDFDDSFMETVEVGGWVVVSDHGCQLGDVDN